MSNGYMRINQVQNVAKQERLTVLRSSLSIINQLELTTEIDSQREAYAIAKQSLNKEINEITSRLTARS